MPYVERTPGVRIHYRVEGIGTPLVMMHGFAGSLLLWQELGYVRALRDRHQLILIDARGHGASSKPHDPASYELSEMAGDVLAVMDVLRVPKARYLGYSMGARIGFALATMAPERISGWVLAGAHPWAIRTGGTFRGVDGSDPEEFAQAFETLVGEPVPLETRTRLLANDLKALAALIQDRPSMESALSQIHEPCLLLSGESDPAIDRIQEAAARIPGAIFVPLPGLTHLSAFYRSDLVLPHVRRFLESTRHSNTQE